MTISASTGRVQHNCNGSLTEFDFTFPINETSDLTIILTDSDDNDTTLTETTDYSVSATNDDYSDGGTVTTVETYASGYTLTILRAIPHTQASNFIEGMATLYETFENSLDKLTMAIQDLKGSLSRVLAFPDSISSSIDPTLPLPSAGGVLGWNVSLDGLENVFDLSAYAGVISSFAETLLDDTDAAAMLATLGLTNFIEADAVITDNTLVRGDGGARKVQKCSTITVTDDGEMVNTGQPSFLAYPAAEQQNFAKDSAVEVVFGTEVFDVGSNFASNIFTAPVDGKYLLSVSMRLKNLDSAATYYYICINTSNRSYLAYLDPTKFSADVGNFSMAIAVVADMDATDTAKVEVYQSGGTAQTDIDTNTYFSGALIC